MKKNDIKKMLNLNEIFLQLKDPDRNVEIANINRLVELFHEGLGKCVDRKHALTKNLETCPHCHKYFKRNKKTDHSVNIIKSVQTYCDSGYGEDDRWAQANFTQIRTVCPYCKEDVVVSEWQGDLIPHTEHDKYGTIYN